MRGFVSLLPTETKKYIPTNPDKLTQTLQKKEEEFKNLKKELESLEAKYEEKSHQVVEIARGHKNFFRIVKEMPRSDTFSYSIRWDSKYHAEWVRDRKRAIREGKDLRSLARYDEKTASDIKKWQRIDPSYREFDNDGVAISINDAAVMIGLINNNTTLLIKDTAFCSVMKRLFEAAYEQAPIIKP